MRLAPVLIFVTAGAAAADDASDAVVGGTVNTLIDALRAGTMPGRATFGVASVIRPTGPWPRLGKHGFEGLSARTLRSEAELARAFPGARADVDATSYDLYLGSTLVVRGWHGGDDSGRKSVTIYEPGVTTVHGLAVGVPFKDVLTVKERRTCETRWQWVGEGTRDGFVRCWVGSSPARFRYVAHLTRHGFSLGPGPNLERDHSLPDAPKGGKDLDRWIATSGATIDMILWAPNNSEAP